MKKAPFQPSGLTHAQQLLSLVFQGHEIRTILQNGTAAPLFVAKDVCAAVEIKDHKKAVSTLLPEERSGVVLTHLRSGPRKRGENIKRTVTVVTESGLFALVMRSRKPAAAKFRLWIGSEVIPQLLKYGTYAPGATAGERCHALHVRWKQERSQELGLHCAALAESGLLTIAAFRKLEPCPGEDALLLSHHLRAIARESGFEPDRFFTGSRRHTPAWPREMLAKARRRANGTHAFSFR